MSVETAIEFPAREYQDEEIPVFSADIQRQKDLVFRAKCLSLEQMGLSPLTDVKGMNGRDKKKLLNLTADIINNRDEEDITADFNELICEKIFNKTDDYTKYAIHCKVRPPCDPPIDELIVNPLEVALEYDRIHFPKKEE